MYDVFMLINKIWLDHSIKSAQCAYFFNYTDRSLTMSPHDEPSRAELSDANDVN